MRYGSTIAVIIPALNEEEAIAGVLSSTPDWVDDIVVVDNGSTDRTAAAAQAGGARVVSEPYRGYGSACLAGIASLNAPEIIVFLDGDLSDFPEEMPLLVDPIVRGEADFVVGSRVRGRCAAGALTLQARFGNWLACRLLHRVFHVAYTDLGPFRAIRRDALARLHMCDRGFGWTVEMQVKAAQRRLRALEVPVSYRRRIGKSKISGTVRGVIGAGTMILATILRHACAEPTRSRPRLSKRRGPEPR